MTLGLNHHWPATPTAGEQGGGGSGVTSDARLFASLVGPSTGESSGGGRKWFEDRDG
ncbi:MAG: hypothetical protein Q9199_000339 [Rusavskia elegans]